MSNAKNCLPIVGLARNWSYQAQVYKPLEHGKDRFPFRRPLTVTKQPH
jgi:hypothetical protein